MTEFKPGDRVKVEYETEFVRETMDNHAHAVVRHPNDFGIAYVPLSALTKLPDPEPEWRKGDVVRFQEPPNASFHVALRTSGGWQCHCCKDVRADYLSARWREGLVTVLHREDQP